MPAAQVPTTAAGQRRPDSMDLVVRPRWWTGRVPIAGALLAVAWLLPLLTHLAGVDALLVPVMLVVLAGLLRGGRGGVDQLLLASVLLFGAFCVVGLATSALSIAPAPVPVAGTVFTALVGLGVATGRRPRIELRLRPADLVVTGAAVLIAALTLRQFIKRDEVGRLALLAPGEDLARHFELFDTIGRLDGYAFVHPARAVQLTVGTHYPQGLHFLYMVLDRFWRSSDGWVGGPAAMDWMVWCHVATYLWFAAAVLWAVRRVAGPAMTAPRAVVVLGAATAYLFFGDPITIMLRGFPNELAGLGLAAVLLAVLARPLHRTVEQIATVALLLVGISFTYYLFLPVAGLVVLGWAVTARARLLRHRVVVAVGVLVASVAAVPVLVNPEANSGSQLVLLGTAIPVSGSVLLVTLMLAVAGIGSGPGLRSPAWRIWAGFAAGSLAVAFGLSGYQYQQTGHLSSYYGEKAYHLVVVVAVIGLGGLVRLLPAVPGPGPGPGPGRLRSLVPTAALLVASFAAFGVVGPASSSVGGSYGMGLLRGREGVRDDGPAVAYRASRAYPDGAGRITVDLSHGAWANFYGTLYGLAIQRTYIHGSSWYAFLYPDGEPKTLADLERQLLATDRPVRLVIGDPSARFLVLDPDGPRRPAGGAGRDDTGDEGALTNVAAARYLAAKYPDRVEVVSLGG